MLNFVLGVLFAAAAGILAAIIAGSGYVGGVTFVFFVWKWFDR
jgi:hypothetical protein